MSRELGSSKKRKHDEIKTDKPKIKNTSDRITAETKKPQQVDAKANREREIWKTKIQTLCNEIREVDQKYKSKDKVPNQPKRSHKKQKLSPEDQEKARRFVCEHKLQPPQMWLCADANEKLNEFYIDLRDNHSKELMMSDEHKTDFCSRMWRRSIEVFAGEVAKDFKMTVDQQSDYNAKLLKHIQDPNKSKRIAEKMQRYYLQEIGSTLGYVAPERSAKIGANVLHQVLLIEAENFARAFL